MLLAGVQPHGDRESPVLIGIRDQLVRNDPKFLGRGGVESCWIGLHCDWHRSPIGDALEQGICFYWVVGLGQQPVDDGDRLNAGGGVVEGTAVTALRTTE